MANLDKIFDFIGSKLGIIDLTILQKSKEFYRLLQNKGSLTKLSDIGKVVLCFDVATSVLSYNLDKELAFKLSGIKKSVYQNTLHNVQKLLNVDKEYSISDLCVLLACSEIKELAENIWTKYKETRPALIDNNHPLYITVSVYTACKLKNVKIDKPKLITLSRSTQVQFKELVNDFQKFSKTLCITKEKKSNKRVKKNDETDLANIVSDIDALNIKSPTKKIEVAIEDYECWKKRILEEAYKQTKTKVA